MAGVGAMALGAEKSKELVDQLIAKGEITVDQGKEINAELMQQAQAAASQAGSQVATAAAKLKAQVDQAAATAHADGADFAEVLKQDILEAQMAMMTPDQRSEFVAKAAAIAARDRNAQNEAKSQAPKATDAYKEDNDPYFNGMEGN